MSRILPAQRGGSVQAVQRQLPVGLPVLHRDGAGDAGDAAGVQIRWTRTWAEKGGKARSTPAATDFTEGEVQRVARAEPKAAS